MSSSPKHIAWIDLETTGTHEHDDDIIEVAVILTRYDSSLTEVGAKTWLAHPRISVEQARASADPFVREMHDKNGLWADLIQRGRYLDECDAECVEWLHDSTGSTQHVALAGSGVAHFDRRFIRSQMPALDHALTYWTLDVGVMRRLLACAGRDDLVPEMADPGGKPHRAMDDIRLHLSEGRHYMRVLRDFQAPRAPRRGW